MREEPALWLFADQLGPHFHSTPEPRGRDVLLIRSAAAFAKKPFHRQKLHLVQAALYRLPPPPPAPATPRRPPAPAPRAPLLDAPDYRTGLRRFGRPVVGHEPTSHAADAFVRRLRE